MRVVQIRPRAVSAAFGVAMILCAGTANPAAAQTAGDGAKRNGFTDKVIISNLPAKKARLRAVLQKLLGKSKGEKLGATGSEVYTVPQSRLGRLTSRLKLLGCNVTRLREDWNHILKRHTGAVAMSPKQKAIFDRVRSAKETLGVAVMGAPEPAVAEYALTRSAAAPAPKATSGAAPEETVARIVMPINDTQQVTVRRLAAMTTDRGTTWRGEVEETGESAMLMWWKDGHMSGVLGYKGHIYTIENMGDAVHAVVEVDPKKMPPDHAPPSADSLRALAARVVRPTDPTPAETAAALRQIKPFSDADRRALEAKTIIIDVMMLYTKKAASRYIRDPNDLTELAIEQANESFRNSGIGNIKLRLVHSQAVDYDESEGEQFGHLYSLVDGVGPFSGIAKLRDEKRADIVGLVLDDASGCGLSTRVAADAEDAYFVVHHSCAAITISIAHEVGHILGARHDRTVDVSNSPSPYGHGHINGTKWRTMMSYQQSCGGCPRIPYWSNPRIKYKGEPTGTIAEDNARVILEQAERVANFR